MGAGRVSTVVVSLISGMKDHDLVLRPELLSERAELQRRDRDPPPPSRRATLGNRGLGETLVTSSAKVRFTSPPS